MAAEQQPDWVRIEADYSAGLLTLRAMAELHGVNHVAIARKAKKEGWTKDLSARIKARAESIVTRSAVTEDETRNRLVTENEVVETNATLQANIILSQRASIQRQRNLVTKLLSELEATTDYQDLFEELGEIMRSPDDKGQDKRNELYNKVISMSGRIDNMKKLSETLKTLVGLERQAFGIADNADGDKPQDKEPRELSSIEIARKVAMALQLGMRQANQMH